MKALGPIVYAFFEQHLKGEKGLSPASVKSYRDALRLFLTFIAASSSHLPPCSPRDTVERLLDSASISSCAAILRTWLPIRMVVIRAASRHTCSDIPRRCTCSKRAWRSTSFADGLAMSVWTTTNRYAEINMRSKEAALEACEPPVNASVAFPRRPIWRDDATLLNWLTSL
jgi:hypothetical protein